MKTSSCTNLVNILSEQKPFPVRVTEKARPDAVLLFVTSNSIFRQRSPKFQYVVQLYYFSHSMGLNDQLAEEMPLFS